MSLNVRARMYVNVIVSIQCDSVCVCVRDVKEQCASVCVRVCIGVLRERQREREG